jgi:membrane associated rhomboid family serine protease
MLGRTLNIRFGGPLTDTVKKLMIINAGIFVIQKILDIFYPGIVKNIFGLSFIGFFYQLKLWQPFTYMFLHGSFFHILSNLFVLWMFGGELEQRWGRKDFIKYYLFTGVGAGLFICVMNFFTFQMYEYSPVTIGASGAVYGILLAYGMTWPNKEVLLYFVIPVKIKYLVIGIGLIEFIGTISNAIGAGGTISHIGHIGGLISGYIILLLNKSKSKPGMPSFNNTIDNFIKHERLKRKQEEIDKRIKAKNIIDSLLEKIAREGMGSLSYKEKNELEWARKHYYPNNEDTVH